MGSARIAKLLMASLFVLAIFGTYTHAQSIEDWFRLRNYSPPIAITAFVAKDSMTPLSQHIFYVTHPTLETNLQNFKQECGNAEKTIVLGCYRSGISTDSNLFIRQISDDRLQGVEQVTAAHEMLHAAYSRLGAKEKAKVNSMLLDYYNNQLQDQRIKDTINSYKKSEPTELVNEMHSIFGTEISSLPAPLENYYKKYFTDRSKVTAFAASYENEFTSRQEAIKADDEKLTNLRDQINSQERDLKQQLQVLESQKNSVENSGSSAQVNAYNLRVNQYNSSVRRYQLLVAQFNSLVEERNAIAKEYASLQESIDSRVTTQPTQ